jgi:hypothetical protein
MVCARHRAQAHGAAVAALLALLATACGTPSVNLPPVGTPVSTRAEIVLRPGLGAAPERLAAGLAITPAVALTYTVRGGELALRPVTAFTPTTRYTLTLGGAPAGAGEPAASADAAPAAAWPFLTRSPGLAFVDPAAAAIRRVDLAGQVADLARIPPGRGPVTQLGTTPDGNEVWYQYRDRSDRTVVERLPLGGPTPRADAGGIPASPADALNAAWSAPDGRHVLEPAQDAAMSPPRDYFMVRDTVTGASRELREPGGGIRSPAWSPDGQRLAYVYEPDLAAVGQEQGATAPSLLVVTGLDGRGRQVVAGEAGGRIDGPAWSPDGQWLAYIRRPGDGAAGSPELWLVRAAGGERRSLVPAATAFTWLP